MRDDPARPGEPDCYDGIDAWESIEGVANKPWLNIHFLAALFMVVLSTVGQIAADNKYWDRTPELELLRHLRNGVSHGNTFNFRPGEPKRPAQYRTFQLTPEHHGAPVLFD